MSLFDELYDDPIVQGGRVSMCVDPKGIVFGNGVAQLLGNPPYIKTKSRGEYKVVAVMGCAEDDPLAREFYDTVRKRIKKISSSSLASAYASYINYDFEREGDLKVDGCYDQEHHAVIFDLKTVVRG